MLGMKIHGESNEAWLGAKNCYRGCSSVAVSIAEEELPHLCKRVQSQNLVDMGASRRE